LLRQVDQLTEAVAVSSYLDGGHLDSSRKCRHTWKQGGDERTAVADRTENRPPSPAAANGYF
jgi:hypothetical protein